MKLRNKKTGEIVDTTEPLADLNKEWGDYIPTKPLIKDEKIRDIIRLWAKVNGATVLKYFSGENCLEDIFRNEIHFNQLLGLEDDKNYTTAELCGEEKE